MARNQSRTDQGRRELGARIHNKHVPSKDRDGDGSASSDVPASIELAVFLSVLTVGDMEQITATVRNAAGTVLAVQPDGWQTANATLVTVDGLGRITAQGAGGPVLVTATLGSITSNGTPITVVGGPDLVAVSVTISPATVSFASGTAQETAVIKNAGGVTLALSPTSWSSSAPTVATVSNAGLVTFVGAGTTNITAHYNAIASNTCVVTGTGGGGGSATIFAMDFETMTASGPATFTGSPNGQTLTDAYADANLTIVSDPTPRAAGKVAEFVYSGSGDGNSDDFFLAFYGIPTQAYGAHLYFRGEVFIPTGSGAWNSADNRKLVRINNSFSAGLNGQDIVLHRVDANDLRYDSQQFVNGGQGPGGNLFGSTGATVANDAWTAIEVHLRMSSAKNALDGLLEVFINDAGSPTLSLSTAMDFATADVSTNAGVPIVAWGNQLTVPFGHTGYTDLRYWDNLKISTARIGA
jgi:hypothetical protein